MKRSLFVGIVAVLLTACTTVNVPNTQTPTGSSASSSFSSSASEQAPDTGLWRSYESKELGLSLSYPTTYEQIETNVQGTMQTQDGQIIFDEVVVSVPGGGESAQIRVLKTRDPKIVQSLSEWPLETVTIAGKTAQRFTSDGMGTPAGFIQQTGEGFIVLTFDFPPSADVMDRVFESLKPF